LESGWQTGSWPETGFAEISRDVPEVDFWPGFHGFLNFIAKDPIPAVLPGLLRDSDQD